MNKIINIGWHVVLHSVQPMFLSHFSVNKLHQTAALRKHFSNLENIFDQYPALKMSARKKTAGMFFFLSLACKSSPVHFINFHFLFQKKKKNSPAWKGCDEALWTCVCFSMGVQLLYLTVWLTYPQFPLLLMAMISMLTGH